MAGWSASAGVGSFGAEHLFGARAFSSSGALPGGRMTRRRGSTFPSAVTPVTVLPSPAPDQSARVGEGGYRSGSRGSSRRPCPLRTVRVTFASQGSSLAPRTPRSGSTRASSLAMRLPARYPNRASSPEASRGAAAPAKTMAVLVTYRLCCPKPVGCPGTCVRTLFRDGRAADWAAVGKRHLRVQARTTPGEHRPAG
jgi:hypothetical protein